MATASPPSPYASSSSPPYVLLLIAVVAAILVVPNLFSEQNSLLEMSGEINPVMVMAAPVVLILVIRWLSSSSNTNSISAIFRGGGDPSSIHRAGGSPVGVAVVLLFVLLMIWYQSSGVHDDSEQ